MGALKNILLNAAKDKPNTTAACIGYAATFCAVAALGASLPVAATAPVVPFLLVKAITGILNTPVQPDVS